ncbi:MAG: class I SAM-dependent methyltransferase [Cyanobacteriota bacterium]|nr:class I SAM-dependent methyltransferase [Cyanobacteriota bacterium]
MDPYIIAAYIDKVYEVLLSRPADAEGKEAWSALLASHGPKGFAMVLDAFSTADEFICKNSLRTSANSLERHGEFDFHTLNEAMLEQLFEKTAQYWRVNASDPKEIYWSVLSTPIYKGELAEDTKRQFMASGADDVRRLQTICETVGFELGRCKSYLEYGCGVGRMVFNLPTSIEAINCVDFSAAHLDEAKLNTSVAGESGRYHFHHMKSLFDVRSLPKNQDIIHSFIVLQHNTPPIIARIIADLLQLLAIGGVALLHIPIAKAYYQFDAIGYLQSDTAGREMEMHILPKANLYNIARSNNCEIVYSYCAGGCGGDVYSEIVVFRKSSGT